MNNNIKTGDISDINGQVAVGNYINQINIENPSSKALIELIKYQDQRRKFNEDILKCYSPSTLPEYPPRLREFVTDNRVYEINQALIYLHEHRILFISGMGGIGKTTLARALVETRPANVPLPFWFDFGKRSGATLGDVLEKLAGYMNATEIAQFRDEGREAGQDDINRLTDELGKRDPLWLIFDNLETALDDRYFHDPWIDSLFTSLRDSSHQAKIIITSRTLPVLADGGSLIDILEDEKQELKGLNTNFAVDYLVKNGLDGVEQSQLEALSSGVEGHPLALKLLIGLVKKFGVKDTLDDLSTFQRHKESTIKKARNLFAKLAGDEKELLERISVFRQPESLNAIKEMFTGRTSEDADEKLIDKSLMETDHRGNYWLHPLVREFAYDDLKNKREVHKLACQYYLSLPLPETHMKKEDVQSLIEAHHNACMAEEYDKAADIIFSYNLHEDLDRWGNHRTLIEIYLRLLPNEHDKILLNNMKTHSKVLLNLGLAYIHQGLVEKAIKYYSEALVISRKIKDKSGEEDELGNLGKAYSNLGQVEKAIEYYHKALLISREIGDKQGEGKWVGSLGIAYRNLGLCEKAIDFQEKALEISREINDRRQEGLWLGQLGITYSYLGKIEKAIEFYNKAMDIAKEIGDKRGEGALLGFYGEAYRYLKQVEIAEEKYKKALAIAEEIGDKYNEGVQNGNLGSAYRDMGQIQKAIEYFEKALVISRDIGDRRNEGNWLRNLGSIYSDLGRTERAIDHYEQALLIGKEIKDPKIISSCEENLESLRY